MLPHFTTAKGFTPVAQAGIEAVAQTDPLAQAGRMDPEATTAVPRFNVHGRQPRCIVLAPSLQQQRWLCGEIDPALGRRGFA